MPRHTKNVKTRAGAPDTVDRKVRVWSTALKHSDMLAFEVAIRIQRLNQLASLPLVDLLKPLKLAPGDVDVMTNLFEAGPPYSLTPSRLSALCLVTTGAMTGRIDRLERSGMVVRVPSKNDRRSQEVKLTKKGLQTVVTIGNKVTQARFATAIAALPRADLNTLARVLRELDKAVLAAS